MLHKVRNSGSEAAVVRVVSNVLLLVCLLQDSPPVVGARLESADLRLLLQEVVSGSVSLPVLSC